MHFLSVHEEEFKVKHISIYLVKTQLYLICDVDAFRNENCECPSHE